ncbi:MAG: hypothetical protein OdinLCB4_003365 [Candidatus Odinarchaeum yellowstonii]|jgi:predicted transcriptional regulator|uniref:Uncharacterized protein n=1 Tax=Odinarchaeota yellowstonii (strain LCB_4) TaxID=1841599 RepID=A0AAF0IC31_ODILC|nr:MAG: hypothetical protein OdinLCB4_003365 [Candidatus Odinarchaeum yellowstonii]
MTRGRVKIEFFNQEVGSKVTLIIEGGLPQNVVTPLETFLLSTLKQPEIENVEEQIAPSTLDLDALTKKQKIELIIIKYFRNGSFNSKDVQELYKTTFDEEVSLSTISTNLSRLVEEGILLRSGPRLDRRYRLYVNVAKKKLVQLYPLIERLKT